MPPSFLRPSCGWADSPSTDLGAPSPSHAGCVPGFWVAGNGLSRVTSSVSLAQWGVDDDDDEEEVVVEQQEQQEQQ